jgi:hypothetical protein
MKINLVLERKNSFCLIESINLFMRTPFPCLKYLKLEPASPHYYFVEELSLSKSFDVEKL